MELPLKKLVGSVIFLSATILVGVVGFILFENLSPLDALYMTVITMSTVGFETIGELTPEGKIFVIFLISFTIGVFLYTVSTMTTFIVEGEVRNLFRNTG